MSEQPETNRPDDDDDRSDKANVDDIIAERDKWKALARKHEASAKSNADKAREFDRLSESQKSEQERLNERVAAAERAAAEAETKALRYEVAAERGLTAAQAKRLTGATREEMLADADDLLESFGGAGKRPPSQKPTENLRGGGDPDDEPEETDPAKLAALHPRGSY